jgi:phosphonate transport system substrate-binding protein
MTIRTASVLLFMCIPLSVWGQQTVFSFGVVPQQSATKLARLWAPVLEMISRQSGVTLRFATAPDIPAFEARVSRVEYDFAYMNPYHFVTFSKAPGYRAMGRARDRRIQGILVVRNDSPLTRIEELAGRELAFPAPLAFAATLLPQAHLRRAAIEFEPRYVSSHDSVYRSVALGLYPAGGGIIRTLNNVDPEVRAALRILWKSDRFTPHAFASRPGLPGEVRQRVAEAMYTVHEDPEGLRRLRALRLTGIERAESRDWDDVRALDIVPRR